MRKLALLVVLCVACKSKTEQKPVEKAPAPATQSATPQPALPDQPAPIAVTTDDRFKGATNALAARHQWVVSGWGTARLGESGSDRVAQLTPAANGDKGAYLVQSGDTFYLVEFPSDGKTSPWMGAATGSPPWKANGGGFIEHTQGHSGGFTRHQLAIRGGEVVILRTTEKNRNEDEKETAYANLAGACAKPCPKAADVFTVKTSKTPDF